MGYVINLAVQSLLRALDVTTIENISQLKDKNWDKSSKEKNNMDSSEEDAKEASQLTWASYKARKIISKVRSSHRLVESLQAQYKAANMSARNLLLDMPVR